MLPSLVIAKKLRNILIFIGSHPVFLLYVRYINVVCL